MDQACDVFDSKSEGIHVLLLVLFLFSKSTLINEICIFQYASANFGWIVCENP